MNSNGVNDSNDNESSQPLKQRQDQGPNPQNQGGTKDLLLETKARIRDQKETKDSQDQYTSSSKK